MKKNRSQKLISQIKGKKNLGVSDDYVLEILSKYKEIDSLLEKDFEQIKRNKIFKEIVKEIRKELHRIYGVYQVKKQWKKDELLNKLKLAKNLSEVKNISREILKLHSSSRERLNYYRAIYSRIFKIIKPNKIIDLACGLNPCSLILSDFKGDLFCYDISKNDVKFLNEYFKIVKKYDINGKALLKDIRKEFNFERADVCFLFKFLDILENKKEFFNNLIKNLKCKYLVVSFSKKTISLKKMKITERKWFLNLLEKLNLDYQIIDFETELFYIITIFAKSS